MFYSMRTHMAGSGSMLKAIIKSVKPIEKVLKDWERQRKTKFPKLCPSTVWHRPMRCQGAR